MKTMLVLCALVASLAACGGGGDATCSSGIAGLCESLHATNNSPASPTAPTAMSFSLLPAAVTTSDCTTNIPFIFSGGTGPYTILTSDNIVVPVSSALPLGSRFYFLASIRSLYLNPDSIGPLFRIDLPRKATVSVLDSQAQIVTATINIASAHATCFPNPLLQTEPASANAHVSEVLAFQISGGQAPFTVTSSDTGVVTVPVGVLPGTSFNAQATFSTRATQDTALLTVTSSDGQKTNIRFTVLPLS